MWKTVALALITIALPVRAVAQTVPDWAQIEAVEVRAKPGPALWHLTRGNSEVWILGLVGAMPKDMDWNKQYLSDLLDGARAVILPPRGTVGVLEGAWLLITYG